ncbi:PAS domain S-box-containing protein [Chitinophaga sp. CF118]|uniref:PAS domain S-box protein n=1 Tax=Chitinophaga sp. CF118 TaxID=1884367 RepID=UPI0008E3B6A8|nr:PAS domain S-box protein [Chitinophaga sp. CF118]SFD79881.1 PAS domain S-box-containing protein [Chitinophaga sp. CF118]
MGRIQEEKNKISFYFKHILHPGGEYSIEKYIFQVISIMTIAILCIFIVVDTIANVAVPPYLLEVLLVLQFLFLFLSQVKRIYSYIINLYILIGFIALAINYGLNAGINGPTLILLFMTFQLALSVTERKWYPFWMVLHIVVPIGCIIIESQYPSLIRGRYRSLREQYIDMSTCFIVAILYMYLVTTKIRGYMLRQQEISAQKSVELAASEIKLQAFFEGLSDQFFLLDDKMNIVHFNREAADLYQKLFGTQPKEGQAIGPILHSSYRSRFPEDFKQSMAGVKISHEQKFNYGDEVSWRQVSLEPARNNTGKIVGATLILKDITKQKISQERLETKNALLEKIAFIQAHEFRGPLTSILSLLPLIKEEYTEIAPHHIEMMEEALKKLDGKIIEIVELANEAVRLEKGS